ncbi:hypothetical protein BN140_0057 [Methanoculleus bourgensis MS2]|uniref:Uncharacterized protein n=1 Tax=Methanoculleus bourgensis (strain ATCC 43281 / DSM 3045 / OCM 15 / MS2) TaxID=1201294 RepID=I7KX73_METBM|nr:hypothetical protein [Methanoculleus bourgensis]CCJ34980.1 hypothetical protein BN140_0057 [Methanoculleus bourgensis MS2]
MNVIGRGRLICVVLLLFILAGGGMAHASAQPGEDVRIDPTNGEALSVDTENARQTMLEEPADTVAYQGSESAFSVFYNPVLLGFALGAVIVLSVGYYLIRTHRRKDAP